MFIVLVFGTIFISISNDLLLIPLKIYHMFKKIILFYLDERKINLNKSYETL